MKKIIKRMFSLLLLIAVWFMIYSLGNVAADQVIVRSMTEEFKERASSVPTLTLERNGYTYLYFEVPREFDYELADQRNVFSNQSKTMVGLPGDILATLESPFPFIPVVHQLISSYFGGHTALVIGENKLLESTGLGPSGTVDFNVMIESILTNGFTDNPQLPTVAIQSNRFLEIIRDENHPAYPYYGQIYRNTFYAMRFKPSDTDYDEMIESIEDFHSTRVKRALYNYLFVFDTEFKYYCSDLVSRALVHVNEQTGSNYNLNQDGFITSVQDIVTSDDLYLTLYHERVGDVIHIYYLADAV